MGHLGCSFGSEYKFLGLSISPSQAGKSSLYSTDPVSNSVPSFSSELINKRIQEK